MRRDRRTIRSEILVRRILAGERSHMAELIGLWEDRLFYYLRRLTDNEQDAWDLLQQTWVRVLDSIRRVRRPESFPAWLYRVARNTAMDHFRCKRVDPDAGELNESPPGGAGEVMPDFTPEDAALMHRGLNRLSRPHREVLTLYFLEDFNINEIAGLLGLPPGTVKSRMHHAKRNLRAVLERKEASGD